jgi:hypothetical protein
MHLTVGLRGLNLDSFCLASRSATVDEHDAEETGQGKTASHCDTDDGAGGHGTNRGSSITRERLVGVGVSNVDS